MNNQGLNQWASPEDRFWKRVELDVSDMPREAYLTTHDGEKVPCLLEEILPGQWQATPVRDMHIDEVHQAYVDLLPGHSSVSFVIQGEEE